MRMEDGKRSFLQAKDNLFATDQLDTNLNLVLTAIIIWLKTLVSSANRIKDNNGGINQIIYKD